MAGRRPTRGDIGAGPDGAPTGSDANSCSAASPRYTMQRIISDTKWGAKIYGSDCSPITNDGDYVQIINFDVTGSCVQGITTNGNYTIIGNRVHYMPGSQLTAAIVVDCCSYTKTGNQVIGNVVDNIGLWGRSISLASSGPGARPTTSASTSIEAASGRTARLRQAAHVAAGQHPVAHRERAVRG